MSEKKTSRGKKPSTNSAIIAVSRAIVQSRKKLGLTQRKAAEKVGIDYRHFQDVEKGKVDVRVSSLFELQKQLGLQLEEYFCDKFRGPTCPASCSSANYTELWDIVFELAENGKCGLVILKKGELVFVNKYLRTLLKPPTAEIRTSFLNSITDPPLLGLSQVTNLQEGELCAPFVVKLKVEASQKEYLAFPRKVADSTSILFISIDYMKERLAESLTMLPLFNLMNNTKQ